MAFFYFFKNDGPCIWVRRQLEVVLPKYLCGPVDFNGKKITFYGILDWAVKKNKGVNLEWTKEIPFNYVRTIAELPPGAGIFNSAYDADIEQLNEVKKRKIPLIDKPCPWIRNLRNQIMNINPDTHQCVLLLDKGHMVECNFESIFPVDIILITECNFKKEFALRRNGKPIHLLCYTVFREKDVLRVIDYINQHYHHSDNILNGYKKTLCAWTKQGLIEEIQTAISEEKLDTIWIICSSELDRSTKSIINEVTEHNVQATCIKSKEDIRIDYSSHKRIGILITPIPLPQKAFELKHYIKEKICKIENY